MFDEQSWLKQFLVALQQVASRRPDPNPAASEPGVPAPPAKPTLRVPPVLPPAAVAKVAITPDLLRRLGAHDADAWAPILAATCAAHGIATPRRIAAFLANVMVESGSLGRLVENLNYTTEALLTQWPKRFTPTTAKSLGRGPGRVADQRGIAEAAYGGRLGNGPPGSGDGWAYRGRGLIQLTGKTNYDRFARRIKVPLEALPAHLETRPGAAESAARFWVETGCNDPAEAGEIDKVRVLVNGGTNGLEECRKHYHAACKLLGIAP